jgi:TetR/AcrR family transcriptional regulator, upper aerobic nicotinate degradation pathway regulator
MRAALKLFGTKEFATVTIKEIAEASGFDSGLIYYYFKDKRDLFNRSVESALNDALSVKSQLMDSDQDPALAIQNWFSHCRDFAEQNRILFTVIVRYANSPIGAARLDRRIREFYANEEAAVANAVTRGIKLRIFRPIDAARLARFVSVHLDGITLASIMRPPFDVGRAVTVLEQNFWRQLGYQRSPQPRERGFRERPLPARRLA